MGHTGACAEVVSLTISRQLEADDEPMTHGEMAQLFEATTVSIPEDDSVDINLRGTDAFVG